MQLSIFLKKLKKYPFRYRLVKRKLSTRNLEKLCKRHSTRVRTLVVHSEDVNYRPYFPNAVTVTKRRDIDADYHVDNQYLELKKLPLDSFDFIICTGLLEHLEQPQILMDDLYDLLNNDGKLVMSASAVFPFHECPENFFHFTPHGIRLLTKRFKTVEYIQGSCGPFETIGILLQRVLIQCDINPFVRLPVELLAVTIRVLDFFVLKQYDTVKCKDSSSLTDSMMPSNVQFSVIK